MTLRFDDEPIIYETNVTPDNEKKNLRTDKMKDKEGVCKGLGMDELTNERKKERTNERTNGRTDGRTDGQTDRRTDGRKKGKEGKKEERNR